MKRRRGGMKLNNISFHTAQIKCAQRGLRAENFIRRLKSSSRLFEHAAIVCHFPMENYGKPCENLEMQKKARVRMWSYFLSG